MTRGSWIATRPTPGEIAVGLAAGIAGLAGSFAFAGQTTDFVAVPVTDWVIATTPGPVTALLIQTLGRASEALALAAGMGLSIAAVALGTVVGARVGRRFEPGAGPVLGTYFGAWTVAAAVLLDPFASVAVAIPAAAAVGLWARVHRSGDAPPGRRAVLRAAGGLLAFVGVSTAVGVVQWRGDAAPLSAIPATERNRAEDLLATARERSLDVAGIPGLVTPTDGFYEVDINPVNPDLTAAEWSLSITGAVDREVTLDYGDLTALPVEHRFATLRCVGEQLNGHEMDNALWTGVPAAELLSEAGPESDCECVMLRAADGYYEEFPLAALEPGLLAFGMNGRLLPRAHGFPVRALVPGHWGEVNVKWLTDIELLEREARGFWELRGWHGTGPVKTVAKLHAVNRLPDGRVQVGGHAYAGLRGVSRVEVSLDGGTTWREARLSDPLPDPDVWRQWAYAWQPSADAYEVVVRAVDGDGTVQPRTAAPPFPSGPSGWVRRTVRP